MRSENAFAKPLHPEETEKQTVGCRHNKPAFCVKNRLPKVCAFVRADGICLKPPRGWTAQYLKLGGEK
jgi:hypothetical protein